MGNSNNSCFSGQIKNPEEITSPYQQPEQKKDQHHVIEEKQVVVNHKPAYNYASQVDKEPDTVSFQNKTQLKNRGPFKYNNDLPEYKDCITLTAHKLLQDSNKIYVGQWRNGKQHGRGKCLEQNGAVYEGYWKEGKQNGQGRYLQPNGDIYEGGFVNNQRTGQATLTQVDGSKFEGEWLNNQKKGFGVQIYHEPKAGQIQERYQGVWNNNLKEGSGKYFFADGSVYEGLFYKDIQDGQGTISYKNGDRYTGEFRNNLREPTGEFLFADGRKYSGSLIKSQFEGQGTFSWKDGQRYSGNFSKGLMHGKGTFHLVDAHNKSHPTKEAEGEWENGRFVKWTKANGSDAAHGHDLDKLKTN